MRAGHRTSPVVLADDAGHGGGVDHCQFCRGSGIALHRVPGERWAICDGCLDEIGRRARRHALVAGPAPIPAVTPCGR